MNMARYPELTDAAAPWVGKVLAHWNETRLRLVSRISNSNVDKKEYDGQVPVRLRNYTDVYYNEVITPDLDFLAATASASEIKKFGLRRGDVIITKDSEDPKDIGIPAYVAQDMPGVVCGYHLSVIRTEDPITAAFVQYSFMSAVNKARMYVDTPGITRFGLDQDTIKNVLILLPPAEERARIVGWIRRESGRIDGLIEKKTRFIALLKEKRAAVITHAVTKGLDPDVPMKDSGVGWLGRVPAHWRICGGAAFLFEKRGRNSGAKSTSYLSLMANRRIIPYEEKGDVGNKKPEDLSKCKVVAVGDSAINSMNYAIGSYGVSR